MSGEGMVLTGRDREVIGVAASFVVVTREQLARLGHFRSKTRANATLARLVRFEYLARRFQPSFVGSRRSLYFLGPRGHELLDGSESQSRSNRVKLLSDLFLEHQLAVNDTRIDFLTASMPNYQVERWVSDVALRELKLGVVPDGFVEYRLAGLRFFAFVEIDRGTESHRVWERKVAGYLDVVRTGRHERVLGCRYFRVLVLTHSQRRSDNLRRFVATRTRQVFWFASFERLMTDGPFASIWSRPDGSDMQSLTNAQRT